MNPVLIIPAYNPDETLLHLLSTHKKKYPEQTCIVINDGSKPASQPIFKTLEAEGITVLHHNINLGKGEALKTGMRHFLAHHANNPNGIITADADGQHSIEDIIKISEAFSSNPNKLHLGIRKITKKNVPLRSRIGNLMTRLLFNRLTQNQIQDTQTGLRGIPLPLIKQMIDSKSSRYEFEFEMFFVAKKLQIPILQTAIQTIYINGNESSHFNPFLDSLKIYYIFFRFCGVALCSFLIDFTLFFIIFYLGYTMGEAMLGARLISASINFFLNKNISFKSNAPTFAAAAKFALLALFIGFSSFKLLQLMTVTGLNVYYSKIIAEFLLFIASFAIQNAFIFCKTRLRYLLEAT